MTDYPISNDSDASLDDALIRAMQDNYKRGKAILEELKHGPREIKLEGNFGGASVKEKAVGLGPSVDAVNRCIEELEKRND